MGAKGRQTSVTEESLALEVDVDRMEAIGGRKDHIGAITVLDHVARETAILAMWGA